MTGSRPRAFARAAAVLASAAACLAAAPPAVADLRVGIATDEVGATADPSAAFATMNDIGLKVHRFSIHWDPAAPMSIPYRGVVDRVLFEAHSRGIGVVFTVTGARAAHLSTPENRAAFAEFLKHLARAYPQVRDFAVGNEPNVPAFWQPQFGADDTPLAGAGYTDLLARAYDALKSVDPNIGVTGANLTARGNDDPDAPTNASRSPVQFVADMGAAYRGMARNAPLMDDFGYHPYPPSPRDPALKKYDWPNAGVADLDRIKQAFFDAFHGTAQRTFEEGLGMALDEIGWQVEVPGSHAGWYHNAENTKVIDEATQAQIYAELIGYLSCDVSVRRLLFYLLTDERDLKRWQSGLLRADGSRRPSYDAVNQTLAASGGRCAGEPRVFRHATDVVGARPLFNTKPKNVRTTAHNFQATADEDARYRAAIFRVASPKGPSPGEMTSIRRLASSGGAPGTAVATAAGTVSAKAFPLVRFPARRLKPGHYVYALELKADLNAERVSFFVSKPFRVIGN